MTRQPPILCVRKGDSGYPNRLLVILGERAPDRLYLCGNQSLLDEHAISFCGARNASEKGIQAASLCARTATNKHFVVTSGNAKGVDRATHREALESGGETVIVLPEGMDHFRIAPELRDVWDWSRVLVVSQFDSSTVWRSYHAMDRNKTIIALSCAMIVVEAGEKGGTRSAGEDALRLRIPLFAIDYGFDENVAPGNRELIKRGAKPLKKSRGTGEPNLGGLLLEAEQFCADVRSKAELARHVTQPSLI
jgi:DNA processing protein